MSALMSMAFVAAIIIAGMFGVLAYLRSKGLGAMRRSGRISVSDYLDIDKGRRLLLLRRDNVEHLVIIGSNGETVVETGIEPPSPSLAVPSPAAAGPAASLRPTPRRPLGPVFRTVPKRSEEAAGETARSSDAPADRDGRSEPELPA